MAQQTGIRCPQQHTSGVLYIPFMACKKVHRLVSQIGSHGDGEALNCPVHCARARRSSLVLLIEEALHGDVVRHPVRKWLL